MWIGTRLLAATALLAATPLGAAAEAGRPVLRVAWHDPSRCLPFPAVLVAHELRAVLDPVGVELEWVEGVPHRMRGPQEVRVILLATEDPRPATTHVMGSVLRRGSGRNAWIRLGAVLRALGLDRPDPRAALPLARALARVAAHEVVHAVAPEHPHAAAGLMAAVVGPRLLKAPEVWIDEGSRAALRQGLSPARGAFRFPRGSP